MSNGEGPPYRITNLSFRNLLQRLGIIPYPLEGFTFDTTIVPVSIVDSDITLTAQLAPATLGTPVTGADAAAPAANAVLADSGALAAGTFIFTIAFGADNEGARTVRIQRRDAANAANIWSFLQGVGNESGSTFITFREEVALNERIRILVGPSAGVAGSTWTATIWSQPS